jgi:hypothetical protein
VQRQRGVRFWPALIFCIFDSLYTDVTDKQQFDMEFDKDFEYIPEQGYGFSQDHYQEEDQTYDDVFAEEKPKRKSAKGRELIRWDRK